MPITAENYFVTPFQRNRPEIHHAAASSLQCLFRVENLRSRTQHCFESHSIVRPHFGIDKPWRAPALERAHDLLGGDGRHVAPRLMGHTGGMEARDHTVEFEQ